MMTETELEAIKREEDEHNKRMRELRDRREKIENKIRAEKLEPLKKLVIKAHDCLCRWNHTDGCGWHYEEETKDGIVAHNWEGWSHAKWLSHYERLIKGRDSKPISDETLHNILDYVTELRKTHPDALWFLRYRLEPT